MYKFIYLLLSLFLSQLHSFAQQTDSCYVKIGGNYYFNCDHIISFSDQDIFTFVDYGADSVRINLDIFSASGIKAASIRDGKLTAGNKTDYLIKRSEEEFTILEKATNRIICHIQKVYNQSANRCEYHISADLYMPDGFYFQCTPETTNNTILNRMKGATFKNSKHAIRL